MRFLAFDYRSPRTVNRDGSHQTMSNEFSTLANDLLSAGCIKFGNFRLKSGLQSPIYIDLRQIISHPRLLAEIAQAYLPILKNLQFARIAGLPYAAIPLPPPSVSQRTTR